MHSTSSILIQAPRERIFETVCQLLRWPDFLPHYRFVRALQPVSGAREGWTSLHMAAAGGWFPVAWKASFRADTDLLELHFEHTAAFTKGMQVVWTLTQTPEGTLVEILHKLSFRVPGLGVFIEPLLQHGFIEPVAKKTLATFKSLLESRP